MKKYVVMLLIGVFCLGFGVCYMFSEYSQMEYSSSVSNRFGSPRIETTEYHLADEIYYLASDSAIIQKKIDNTLTDKIVVKVESYPAYYDVTSYKTGKANKFTIQFDINYYNRATLTKEVYRAVIDDLKAKNIHNFLPVFYPVITVYVPSSKENQIQIDSTHIYLDDRWDYSYDV